MNATLRLLARQHEGVLARLASIEAGLSHVQSLAEMLAYLEDEVARHFTIEEKVLFPLLATHPAVRQGPLVVVEAEHAAFGELVLELRHAVYLSDIDLQWACAVEIIGLLRRHIAKEEQILFPMATECLTAREQAQADEMAQAMGALTRLPPR